jgi:hypothetical protein
MANGEAPEKKKAAAAAGARPLQERKGLVPRPGEALADIGRYIDTAQDFAAGIAFTEEGNKTRTPGEFFPKGTLQPSPDPEQALADAQIAEQTAERKSVLGRRIGGFNAQLAVPGFNEMVSGNAVPQQIGTSTTTRTRPNVTPEQLQAMSGEIDFEARAWSAQYDAKSAGMGLLSNAYQDLNLAQQEQIMPIVQEAEKIFDDAQRQLVGIQEMADDVRANRINPGQFFANLGDAGVFAASMAVAAGHLASAMGGGPNTALGVINGAIERNMRAQALNQAHDRAVLNSEIQILDRMRALGIDRLNQANVYNGLLISQAQSQFEAIAAASASVELRAQIGIVQAQLGQKKQEMFMRARGTITSMHQMKLFALQSGAQSSAKQSGLQIFSDVVKEQSSGEGFEQMSQEKQQAQIAAKLRERLQEQGASLSPGEKQAILNTGMFSGMESNLLNPIEEGQGIGVVDRKTKATQTFVPTAQFENTFESPMLRKKALEGFRAEAGLVQDWQRLYELSEEVISTSGVGGRFSKLVGEVDGKLVIKGSPSATKKVFEMQALLNRITVQTKRAQSGGHMEAVHGEREYQMFQVQALLPSDAVSLATMILGGKFSDQVKPGVDMAWQQFETNWAPLMSGVGVQ